MPRCQPKAAAGMWFCWVLIREREASPAVLSSGTRWGHSTLGPAVPGAALQPWHGQRNKRFAPIQPCTEALRLCQEPEGSRSALPAPRALCTSWMVQAQA